MEVLRIAAVTDDWESTSVYAGTSTAAADQLIVVAINKTYAGDGERKRLFLDELDPDAGRPDEVMPDCSLLCYAAEQEVG